MIQLIKTTNFTEAEINGFLMKKSELNHKYHLAHKDVLNEKSRKYYEANKDKCKETSRKYYEANKDAINAITKKRRDDKRAKDEEENLKKIK